MGNTAETWEMMIGWSERWFSRRRPGGFSACRKLVGYQTTGTGCSWTPSPSLCLLFSAPPGSPAAAFPLALTMAQPAPGPALG